MPGIDKSTQRAIAVIALLILAAWALNGYLPGGERGAARERPPSSPWALYVDIALLSAAVAVMGIAIIARLRDRRARPPSRAPVPEGSGMVKRPTWRFSLIALALIVGWLLMVMVLTRVAGPATVDPTESGGITISEPSSQPPENNAAEEPRPEPPEPGANVVGYLIPPMLVLLVLVVVGTVIVSRRQRRATMFYPLTDDPTEPSAAPAPTQSLARAAELGLAEIGDLSREPREAIIACYAAMERELTHVPGVAPQDFDTPTEVLARAVDHHALRADSATQLVELFEEARFSPHVMNEGHRDVAIRILRLVLGELRSIA
jgi:Domain of unknown function (DUF4129)